MKSLLGPTDSRSAWMAILTPDLRLQERIDGTPLDSVALAVGLCGVGLRRGRVSADRGDPSRGVEFANGASSKQGTADLNSRDVNVFLIFMASIFNII